MNPNYTEIPPTNSEHLRPPPVQGIPPSYPTQHPSGVPYGQPTPGYGIDINAPYGSAPPPPAAGYPDPRYNEGYHNYPPQQQPGVYPPPTEQFNTQANPQQVDPTASTQDAATPGNNSNETNPASLSTVTTETAPSAEKDNLPPSNAGEASSNTGIPGTEVPTDANASTEPPSKAADAPPVPVDQKNTEADSKN